MTGDARRGLYDIVARAIEADPAHRMDLVEGACGGDAALRDEVLRALKRCEGLGGFLQTPGPTLLDLLAAPGPPVPPGATVGRYRLERVIGSGGSGTVYEALQESPHRKVAIKVMASGLGSSPAAHRLAEEAEILARLHHPAVAHVYEAGVHEGLPWLAIEYVEGRDIVAHAARLPVREKLDLMAHVCDAVHHGHEQGILHGDLKPTNILVDAAGRPKVIDFGIARALGADAEGEIAGTPPYMSPEQCEGARLDVRSDVYALGAVLYEILAGRRVLDVSGLPLAAALRAVREEEPVPIERVDPRLRGDVAAIVGKTLARARAARYASAAALADDLRRHLAHRPVEARPPRAAYVAGRFVRRQPLVALLGFAVIALSVAAGLVGTRLAWEKERERQAAEGEREAAQRQAYVASLAAASAALRADDVAEARQQLEHAPERLRGWEWRHLSGRLDDSAQTIRLPGLSVFRGAADAAGKRAAVTFLQSAPLVRGVVGIDLSTGDELFRVVTGEHGPYSIALDAAGTQVAVGYTDGGIDLRDAATGALRRTLEAHDGMVNGVAFDAEGRRLASAGRDRVVRIWDVSTGAPLATIEGHADRAICVSFDPSGGRIASGGREGTVRIFDLTRGEHVLTLSGHEGSVEKLAWSPDGHRIATVSRDGTLRLWDAATGAALFERPAHGSNVSDIAYTPDGRTIASVSWDRTLRLWDGGDARPLACLHGHESPIYAVAITPADIVTFGREVKRWSREARDDVPALYGHGGTVTALAFTPDGRRLASGASNGTVRLWDVRTLRSLAQLVAPESYVGTVAFTDGGSKLLAIARGSLRCWSLDADGTPTGERDVAKQCVAGVAVAGGRAILAISTGGLATLDLATSTAGPTRQAFDAAPAVVAFDPTAKTLAAGTVMGNIVLLDASSFTEIARTRASSTQVNALTFSPDGRTLAAASAEGRILLLDARTLAVRTILDGHGGPVTSLAFDPDGARLVSGGEDATVRLWSPQTGEALLVLHGPRYGVYAVAWSPDGSTIASGEGTWEGVDSCIRLWRVR